MDQDEEEEEKGTEPDEEAAGIPKKKREIISKGNIEDDIPVSYTHLFWAGEADALEVCPISIQNYLPHG